MNKLFLILFLLATNLVWSQENISGIILDSATNEPLPFVNISIKGTTSGAVSSLNGKFEISTKSFPVTLVFSFVGYAQKEIVYYSSTFKKIHLVNVGFNLNETVVYAGPNPAELIMKKVLANRKINNPEKNCTFQYTSYNKLLFTIEADSASLAEKIKLNTLNKDDVETLEFMKKQHIFLMESVSEKKFAGPNKVKETILASKISGFQSPAFSVLSTQLQSFHFYNDEISLSEIKYIGPVSNGGLHHYRFDLKDTFYLGNDSVYVISFYPKNSKDSRCMKGLLQIHTDGYALYNVIAEPVIAQEKGFGIKISQQYKKVNNQQWFPYELKSKLLVNEAKIESFALIGLANGKIENIILNPEFSNKEFNEIEVELDKNIENNSRQKLDELRSDSLNLKEKETYRVIDSIGQANHFDKKIMALKSLIAGYVPIKFLNWDITKLFNYNEYEKFRIGLGLRTNHKISKWFSVGGYLAYGFGDKAFKYGSDIDFSLHEKKQIKFNLSYTYDIETASISSYFDNQRYLFAKGYAALFNNRYDSITKYEARFSFRTMKHFKVYLFGNYQERSANGNYYYRVPLSNEITYLASSYTLAETGVEIKMAPFEKFIETPFGIISKGTKWPVLYFRFTKGWKDIYQSEFDYDRFTFKMDKKFTSLRWGTISMSVNGGKILGNAPYHLLFNPTGTYKPIRNMTVYAMDGFETMRTNETIYDAFLSFHFRYHFAKPIINAQKFKPTLSFSNATIIGDFKTDFRHENLNYSIYNKPYHESGIIIDNLVKSGISGIGLGFFYRWGEYSLPEFKDNIAVKISISMPLE